MSNLTEYQRKALGFGNHIALTANAGSGKTFVLSRRFVKIALESNVSLNSIVAITFTEKAASELYVKISGEISSQLSKEQDYEKRKKLLQIRAELINAKISTIHSFCSEILREYAAEAGIDASFIIIDEQQRDELIEIVIDEFINTSIQNNNEGIKKLIRIFGSILLTKEMLKQVIFNSNIVTELKNRLYCRSTEELEEYYESLKHELFSKYFIKQLPEFKNKFLFINSMVEDKGKAGENKKAVSELLDKLNPSDSLLQIYDVINTLSEIALTSAFTVKKRGYLDSQTYEKYVSEINFVGNYVKEFLSLPKPDDSDNKELIIFSKEMMDLFSDLVDKYEERKFRLSYMDFEDLMSKTVAVIKDEKVLSSLKEKYKFIMIDEYQDTNEIQYNIFMPILDELRNGNLFIVGDDKQSIYAFRNAELEVFNKTRNEIKQKSSNSILELPHCFRLSPKLAFFTNFLFEKLFHNPVEYFNEVENSSLISTRNDFEIGGIEFLIADGKICESDLIADKILWLIRNREIKFGDIAVLSRRKAPFYELEKEFIKKNIPYITVGGQGFYQRQIVFDINNYLMFLINPLNDLALTGILRSPFFYFSDKELFLVSQEKGDSLFEKLGNYSSKNSAAKKIYSSLKKYLNSINELSPTNLIVRLLHESGYYSVLMSRINAEQEVANLEKLLSITRRFLKSGFKSLYDLSEYLKSASVEIEDEGQAAVESESNAVKLMTIHKAKGLQFKVVFLIDTNSQLTNNSVSARNLIIDKEYGILTKLPADNLFDEYRSFSINEIYNFRTKKKQVAELKRLLYVGVTRAVDWLFISSTLKKEKPNQNSFWDFISESLNFYPEMSEINISGKLDLLVSSENNFINQSVDMKLKIPVSFSPIGEEHFISNKKETELPEETFNRKVDSKIHNEIISATKIAVFSQCPLKYYMMYNLGLGDIIKKLKEAQTFDELNVESEEKIQPNLAGTIIHNILQNEPTKENLDEIIFSSVKNNINILSEINLENLYSEIKQQLEKYFSSDVYMRITSYPKFYNEYQIYLKENDYFLFGIIDKIIADENKLIIVDYKTDSVNSNNVQKKIKHYFNQLMFYAYISSKYFDSHKKVELNLVFIKSPELSYTHEVSNDEVLNFGGQIYRIIQEIRSEKFQPDLSHCESCVFYHNKSCIASPKN
jgi:ATP-dependent helicase/nuclease subunit A